MLGRGRTCTEAQRREGTSWLGCAVWAALWIWGGAVEDEAGEASLHAVEHLLYPHVFLPILVTDSLLTLIPALSIWHLAHDA